MPEVLELMMVSGLNYHFNDPVHLFQTRQVVLQVADGDELGVFRDVEGCGS